MSLHTNWRDAQAWRDAALPLSTTNNEAAKMFDATLTQYIGWYDNDSVGGIEASCAKMTEADPEFVMGHVLGNGLELMGTGRSLELDASFRADIDKMVALANKSNLTDREKKHVNGVKAWADRYKNNIIDIPNRKLIEATHIWEDILVDHPTDILATKFAHDAYFYLGLQPQMRNSIEKVMPHWSPSAPLYNYLYGMKAFGLVETNFYAEAERAARKGLELNPRDAWSTHALAHVLEMGGRADEGVTFLSTTVKDWESCGMLACHNFWHWALYHIEKGEHQGAVDIFDAEVSKRVKSGAMLDIVDATSLLYRLQLEGVNVGDRWEDVHEICRPHLDDHLLAFNDAHLLMACVGAGKGDSTQKMMASLKDFVQNGSGTNHEVTTQVGMALCEAFVAYDESDFSRATYLLTTKQYDILKIGGSDAQRDIFNQFLIHTALKSPDAHHNKLARGLLYERKAQKENSPLTDRLLARAMAAHAD